MVFECTESGCDFSRECGHCVSVHFSQAHPDTDESLEIDTSRICFEMDGDKNPAKDDEVGERLSEFNREERDYSHMVGESNPMNDPEAAAKISEFWSGRERPNMQGEKHHHYGVTGEDHPAWNREVTEEEIRKKREKLMGHEPFREGPLPEEAREKVSEALMGHEPYFGGSPPQEEYIEELGHSVTGGWEKWVAFALRSLDLDYENEPRFEFEDGSAYYPDFQVGSLVIEVKGWPCGEFSKTRAEKFLDEFGDEYQYVVVGVELPCDVFVPWDNRDRLLNVASTGGVSA